MNIYSTCFAVKNFVGIASGFNLALLSLWMIISSSKCFEQRRLRCFVLFGTNPGFVTLTFAVHISHCLEYFKAQGNLMVFIQELLI